MFINKFNIAELLSTYQFAQGLSSNLMQASVSSSTTNLYVDYDLFDKHIFFNNSTRKIVSNLNRIIDEYPIGLSGAPVTSLSAYEVAQYESWSLTATNFQKYLVDFLCGATGQNTHATLTASATSNNGEVVIINVLERDASNNVLNLTAFNNITKLIEFSSFFDEGAVRFKLSSGTGSEQFIIPTYDYPIKSKIIPNEVLEPANRGMEFDKMFPDFFFETDSKDNFKNFLSVFAEFFDSLKIFIDQFPDLTNFQYSGFERAPEGMIQFLIAKQYGLNLFENVITSILPQYYQKLGRTGLQKITYSIWNRVLVDFNDLLKAKGTITAFERLARDFGIYNGFVTSREYVDNIESASNFYTKNTFMKLPLFGQSFDSINIDANYVPDWDFQVNNFDIDFGSFDYDIDFQ